jgi:hypothetical protein
MRKTLGVCVLVLLLSGSAVAGEMPNDGPAPPQSTGAIQEQTTDGEISTTSAGSLTRLALDLLAALPSLL